VLVTFLYANCPDVCPLIAAKLRAVKAKLGAQGPRVQLVAISVDPRGDSPPAVAAFLRAHALTGQMEYLRGSAGQLGRVWAAWQVGSQRDSGHPELVAHSALVYGITAGGRLTTVYPPDFDPADVAHDVPLLAGR
jgi:protein SCO1/2